MKAFNDKTENELKKLLIEKRKALQAFRFAISGSKTRNVKEGRNTRKDVARILTALNKKA
jgi:ribosomal protein L29